MSATAAEWRAQMARALRSTPRPHPPAATASELEANQSELRPAADGRRSGVARSTPGSPPTAGHDPRQPLGGWWITATTATRAANLATRACRWS